MLRKLLLLSFTLFLLISLFPLLASAGPLDVWHWQNPYPQGNDLRGITFGTTFVAVGDHGTIMSSMDGGSWEVLPPTTSQDLYGITYAIGLYVAVGENGTILISTDAQNWVDRTYPSILSLRGVAWGNGIFVAVGDAGLLLTSADGITWIPRTRSEALSLRGIIFENGRFVAVGDLGTTVTSQDGIVWTEQPTSVEYNFNEVASNGTILVSVGTSRHTGFGIIVTSTGMSISPAYTDSFNAITYINGQFVAVGDDGIIMTSSDGIQWIERASDVEDNLYLSGVAYGNNTYVVVGGYGAIFTSPDGTAWTRRDSGSVESIKSITYGNGIYVAVGIEGAILTSPDAKKWTESYLDPYHDLCGVTYGAGIFVAVGFGFIATSVDGTTWMPVHTNVDSQLEAVTFGNGMFVAVGDLGIVVTSTDGGATWYTTFPARSDNIPLVTSFYDIVYGDGLFVAVGLPGLVMTSPDGKTWTERTASAALRLTGIAYGNGMYVTPQGLISTNGTDWTSSNGTDAGALATQPGAWLGIAYGDGRFLVVGDKGIFDSQDGISWTAHDSPAQYQLFTAFYHNNSFIVAGGGGGILQSDSFSGNCTATLSSNFSLHIPILTYNENSFWADFSYVPNTLNFTLTNYGVLTDTSPYTACTPAALSAEFELHVPMISFANATYWADFQYVDDLIVMLKGAGLN